MTLQNRVTPFGELVADPARGTLFGNRGGMFHDPVRRALTGRRWASRRWLCCRMDYDGSHRHPVWSSGYTQLFFLDEVTALAAGHRPCAECRRPAARAFLSAAATGRSEAIPGLVALDLILHGQRLDGRAQRRTQRDAGTLPDGAMIALNAGAAAIRGGHAHPWTSRGYGEAVARPLGSVEVLTPPVTLAALASGYAPLWHETAHHVAGTG